VTTEPLSPLADAVSYEVTRLVGEYQGYGMDLNLTVSVDQTAATVTVRGEGLAAWGPRQMLEARLNRAGLHCQVLMPDATFVIHPSTT
jgi:carbohydrate-binding DOMON domain-containing protein